MRGLFVFAVLALAMPTQATTLAGHWYSEGEESIVEITRDEDGVYSGRIVWLAEPLYTEEDDVGPERIGEPKHDLNNPDEDARATPIIGLEILKDFTGSDGRWSGGTVYDPDNGRTYKCTMRLDREGRLVVRGYIGVPAFGRSTTWNRVPAADLEKHLEREEAETR